MAKKVLIHNLSQPLQGVTTASFDVRTGTGNLAIDRAPESEQLLAAGTIEYMEGQNPPAPSVQVSDGHASFVLRGQGGRQASIRMPWSACNASTTWHIRLNPAVTSDVTAYSGGGNIKLDLKGMAVSRVCADSGGGNLEVVLPENAASLDVSAKSGGGNVTVEIGNGMTGRGSVLAQSGAGNVAVYVPAGLASLIHASTGMGKLVIDPQFVQLDRSTFQSPDYETAADRLEICVKSGAGNVSAIIS